MAKRMEKKYIPLAAFFLKSTLNEVKLTYTALENIIGQQLPNAAYLNSSWWKKTKPPAMHFHAWTEADYYVKEIELGRTVTFAKISDTLVELHSDQKRIEDILIIRPVDLEDARSIIQLYQAIDSESDFMLFGKDERVMTVQSIRKQIGSWKKSLQSNMFVGILNGQFAGFVLINGGPPPRASHRASLDIGVRKIFHGKNVGVSLMEKAQAYALETNIQRIELSVREKNSRAISLFEKMGYSIEGTRTNSLKVNGELVNEFYMAKLL